MKKAIKDYLAKLQDNKKDKGFSLVELIIVIAIMAILVGVVASQVLPYIEKSRKSKDQEALSNVSTEMITAISEALADGTPAEAGFTLNVSASTAPSVTAGSFAEAVLKKYGAMKNVASAGDADGLVAVASAEDASPASGGSGDPITIAQNSLKSVAAGLKSKAASKSFTIEYKLEGTNPVKRTISVRGSETDTAVQVSGSLN